MSKLSHPRSAVNKFMERIFFSATREEVEKIAAEAEAYIRSQSDSLRPQTLAELRKTVADGILDWEDEQSAKSPKVETIGEYLVAGALAGQQERLGRLVELNAPEALIESTRKQIAELEAGEMKVGGDASLLDLPAANPQWKTGRGGKRYCEFEGGVRYFPQAQFGRFISR